MRRTLPAAFLVGTLTLSATAAAQVVQPNGLVVPTDDTGRNEMRLDAFFASRGEPIDWRADAHSTPNTFSPLCGFRATLMRVDSGSKFGVGWYNVDPGATAPPMEVHEIIPRNASPGQVFTGDDIRSSPHYAGGLIGFALIRENATPPYYYSEPHWNPYCDQGDCAATPGHWVMSLTYQSQNIPNAWYLGFEDGGVTSSGWSNDGDYNDSLFLFEGLLCAGGGEPCTVDGAFGECAAGLTECLPNGSLACQQVTSPTEESCDGIDNDCNGLVDDGDGLCPDGELCHQGQCVPRCGTREFLCAGDEVCSDTGVCVDPACAEKECESGQACVEGECIAPCDGAVCPGDQVCRLGRCVDPCDGVRCDEQRVCVGGVCVESCDCRGCSSGLACQGGEHPRSGQCVPEACLDVICDLGTVCTAASAGSCVDPCASGVVCPRGQHCEDGGCVPVPKTPPPPPPQFGGSGEDDGPGASPGRGGEPGADAGAADAHEQRSGLGEPPEAPTLGCGCRLGAAGERRAPTGRLVACLAALGILALRRSSAPERGALRRARALR